MRLRQKDKKGEPTCEARAEDKLVCTMPYEKEEDERSEINWDRLGGEGGARFSPHGALLTTYSLLLTTSPYPLIL